MERLRGTREPVDVSAKLKNLMMSGVPVLRYLEILIAKPQQPRQQMQVGVFSLKPNTPLHREKKSKIKFMG